MTPRSCSTLTLPPGGRDRGAGDASEQRPEPTEIPVPDPPGGDDEDLYSPDLTDASEQHPEPAEIPVPDPVVHNIDVSSHSGGSSGDVDVSRSNSSSKTTGSTSSSSSLSSSSSPSPPKPAEWPPAGDGAQLRKWVRYDAGARRFRTSNSMGPMWSDVIQRVTIDNRSGEVIRRENITGKEKSKDLHRPLPEKVKSVKTNLVYKRVRGHPDPGVDLSDVERPDREGQPNEDARLFDYRVKRGLDDVSGGGAASSSAPQRSKIFGAWVAVCKTEVCDRSKHPAMANIRDLKVFKKLLYADMICDENEIHGAFVALTKKGAKELNERKFTVEEVKLFDSAKVTEIENLEKWARH